MQVWLLTLQEVGGLTRRRFDEAEVLWLLLALLIKGLDGRRSVSTHDAPSTGTNSSRLQVVYSIKQIFHGLSLEL